MPNRGNGVSEREGSTIKLYNLNASFNMGIKTTGTAGCMRVNVYIFWIYRNNGATNTPEFTDIFVPDEKGNLIGRIKYEALQKVRLLAKRTVLLKSNTQYCSNNRVGKITINLSFRGRNARYIDFGDSLEGKLSVLKKGGIFYMIMNSAYATSASTSTRMELMGTMDSRLIYFH